MLPKNGLVEFDAEARPIRDLNRPVLDRQWVDHQIVAPVGVEELLEDLLDGERGRDSIDVDRSESEQK